MPNIGGSSLFSVTNRPASSIDGSGCAASDGTHRVRTFEVGDTSTGSCRSARYATSRGSSIDRIPCPIRSACRKSIASHTVSAPVVSPACGTQCSPAAAAAANTSLITSRYGARPASIPPMPNPVSASGGCSSACVSVGTASSPAVWPGNSRMYPILSPCSASASRVPTSSASVITASGMPMRRKAAGPNCISTYLTRCAARSRATPRTRSAMSSGSLISPLTAL